MCVAGLRVDIVSLFWTGVIAVLLALAGAQAVADQPRLLSSWNGWLMVALMLAYLGWYVMVMRLRRIRHGQFWGEFVDPWRIYLLIGVCLAITAALLMLHQEFVGLLYIDVGVIVMAFSWRGSVLPLAAVVLLFLTEGGLLHAGTAALGYSLFSICLTMGISYSIKVVLRERHQREQVIAELHEAQRQLRLAAARDVELAALQERNRLAREMHDSLGHALVLISVKMEAVQRLQAVDPARAIAEWEDTKALVRSTMADLRSSLVGLRLSALDEQPFADALGELAGETGRRTGIEVACEIADCAEVLDRDTREALYRVVQEALTNVAKHAHAPHAWVRLAVGDDGVLLEVTDDGIGLGATPRQSGSHYGVTGMRERVEALGGVVTLGPRQEGGTLLRARIPVKEGAVA
jgi:signal transduction histidine kinase